MNEIYFHYLEKAFSCKSFQILLHVWRKQVQNSTHNNIPLFYLLCLSRVFIYTNIKETSSSTLKLDMHTYIIIQENKTYTIVSVLVWALVLISVNVCGLRKKLHIGTYYYTCIYKKNVEWKYISNTHVCNNNLYNNFWNDFQFLLWRMCGHFYLSAQYVWLAIYSKLFEWYTC